MINHLATKRKRRPKSGRRQDTARVAAFSAWRKANPIVLVLATREKTPRVVSKTEGLNLLTLVSTWTDRCFLFRSSYYSGRDANCGDLNSRHLELFYKGIQKDIGKDEATNFAKFVNTLTDLSASAFIQAFEQFWYSDCQLTSLNQATGTRNQLTSTDEDQRYTEAMILIAGAIGGRRLSEEQNESKSYSVKWDFIKAHQAEIGEINRPAASRYGIYGW